MSQDIRSYWAYCLGEVDGQLGKKIDECPFKKTDGLYREWLRGYIKCGGKADKGA